MVTKVMVSFPTEFLAEVDRIAEEEHRSRSELLREALRLYIQMRQDHLKPDNDSRVRRAFAALDAFGKLSPGTGEDSTDEIRYWRETRWSGK